MDKTDKLWELMRDVDSLEDIYETEEGYIAFVFDSEGNTDERVEQIMKGLDKEGYMNSFEETNGSNVIIFDIDFEDELEEAVVKFEPKYIPRDWKDVYNLFEILANEEDIRYLCNKHKGEKAWDTACEKWFEDDELEEELLNFNGGTSIEFFEYNGKCPIEEFIDDVSDKKLRAKIFTDMCRLSELGSRAREPLSSYQGDGIFEMRTKQGSNVTRAFYFFAIGDKIVMTNGYVKKSQKRDEAQFKKAKKYRDIYNLDMR